MSQNTTSSGIGFWGLLTIALIVLKLTAVISWSWWLILIPVWLPISLLVIGLLCILIFGKR